MPLMWHVIAVLHFFFRGNAEVSLLRFRQMSARREGLCSPGWGCFVKSLFDLGLPKTEPQHTVVPSETSASFPVAKLGF